MKTLKDELKMSKPFSTTEEELAVLFNRLNFNIHNHVEVLLKKYKLTEVTYNILRILRGAGVAGLPCAEISKRMLSRVPDVTRLIDRMVRLNYVDRKRNEGDRRVVLQILTDTGLKVVNEIDSPLEGICLQSFENLSVEEKHNLLELLTKLFQNPYFYEKEKK